MLGQPAVAVEGDLTPAVSARLLRPSGNGEDRAYAFTHALQRDAIYAELPPETRRALHRRAATALAQPGSPSHAVPWAVVALHAERARDWPLARDASLAAGDAAVAAFAGIVALDHYRRARALMTLGQAPATPADAVALDQRIVSALLSVGRLDEAIREAHALVARAVASGSRALEAWAWIRIGQAETFAHHLAAAREALAHAQTLAEALGDEALLATALSETSVLLDKFGYLDEAAAAMARAMPLAEKLGDRSSILGGLDYLGYAATWRGEFDAAVRYFTDARGVSERAHDVFSLASARFGLALAEGGRGRYEAALAALHHLLGFAAETGASYYAARAPNTIGWIYRELGLLDLAREWDERAVSEAFSAEWPGHFEARANSLLNLATDLILLGRLEEAGDVVPRAAEAADGDEFMRWRNVNRLALVRGELALARGDAARALEAAADAVGQAEAKHAAKYSALAHDLASRSLSALGRRADAVERHERAAAIAGAIGYGARWRIIANLAAALEQSEHAEAAAQRRSEALTIVEDIAQRVSDRDMRAALLATPEVVALRGSARPGGAADPKSQSPQAHPMGLSAREVDVLRLVARGLSNREIADALTISERTVNSHLVHIFNKLEVNSRAAAAAQALRLGLAD